MFGPEICTVTFASKAVLVGLKTVIVRVMVCPWGAVAGEDRISVGVGGNVPVTVNDLFELRAGAYWVLPFQLA